MPTNTIEYLLSLKDNFSSQFKQAASSADSAAGKIVGTAHMIASGVSAIGPVVSGGLKLLEGDYSQLGSLLGSLPGPIGVVGGAIGSALGSAMEETVKYTESMRKAATATGTSVSFMSQFVEAADDQFISQETVTASLGRFAKALGGAQDMEGGFNASGKGVAQVLKDMGIQAEDAHGKTLPLEQLIPQIADKFHEMGPSAKTSALAVQLFGKQGQELLPVLLQGSAAMKKSMDAARDMGLAIDDNAVSAVTDLKQQQDALSDSFTAAGRQLSVALIPAITELSSTLNSIDWKEFGNTIEWLFHGWDSDATKAERLNKKLEAQSKIMSDAAAQARNMSAGVDTASGSIDRAADSSDKLKKVPPLFDTLQDVVYAGAGAFNRYADMAVKADRASLEAAVATQAAADAQANLKSRTDEVIGAIGQETGVMGEAKETQTILELATGKTTEAQIENEAATKAVMKALADGHITQDKAVVTLKQLSDGTIKAKDAFHIAGASGQELAWQVNHIESEARRAQAPVGQLAGNLNAIPNDKVVSLDAQKGQHWDEVFGPNGYASGLHDGTVTKTLTGITDPSFGVTLGDSGKLKDSSVSKKLYGQMDGSFTAAKDYWYSIDNGNATAHIFTSVDIIYNPPACFPAGTPVDTLTGVMPIERLRIGDMVYAYDHAANQVVERAVTQTFAHEPRPTISLWFSDRMITCTREHPFYDPLTQTYRAAGDLRPGDCAFGVNGEQRQVVAVTGGDTVPVYNIEVGSEHNYFVLGTLVHNAKLAPIHTKPTSNNAGAAANALTINNSFNPDMSRQQAQMISQAQARAARQAMLRTAIGA